MTIILILQQMKKVTLVKEPSEDQNQATLACLPYSPPGLPIYSVSPRHAQAEVPTCQGKSDKRGLAQEAAAILPHNSPGARWQEPQGWALHWT